MLNDSEQTVVERCPNNLPIRLGNDRYQWRRCLFEDFHTGPCDIDREVT